MCLVKNGIAVLKTCPDFITPPNDGARNNIREFQEKLLEEEEKLYKILRKEELESTADKIIQGKRKKGDKRPKEDILQEQLEKFNATTEDAMIWPIFLESSLEGIIRVLHFGSVINKKQICSMTIECHVK